MNNQKMIFRNSDDENGNPAGGYVEGTGLRIDWQDGPLGRGVDRKEPNGAFVETVIRAAATRLEYYQDSKFHSPENATALYHLKSALEALASRTAKREEAGSEGTHKV